MIAIKNIKMPSSCYDCPFAKNKKTNDYGSFCECGVLEDYETINLLEHSKHPNCPLVEQEPFINKPCISEKVCEHDKNAVLDKIRAEIEELDAEEESVDYDYNDTVQTETIHTVCREQVFEILDKYKAESEDKKNEKTT